MTTKEETYKHKLSVQFNINQVIHELLRRGYSHDMSKLDVPEDELFEKNTAKLSKLTYGSPEYFEQLKELRPALIHHYQKNDHHPEYYATYICKKCSTKYDGPIEKCIHNKCSSVDFDIKYHIEYMNLIDIIEMLCDWKAATKRHNDGDIKKSIEINQKRFGYSDELKSILLNTLPLL